MSPEKPDDLTASKAPPPVGDRERWLARYMQRMIDVAGLSNEQAAACAAAETFERLSEDFEDDPEGAADEEMSYWDGD